MQHPWRSGPCCAVIVLAVALGACSRSADVSSGSAPLDKARCGPADLPEGDIQGQVPRADRLSGRSQQGYRCNLELVGQYQGEGSSWVSPSSGHCAYLSTSFLGSPYKRSPGVQVVDASDPAHPRLAGTLVSPSMAIGPWESLKVNEARRLLASVAVGPVLAAAFFDVYDIGQDCSQPVHLNSLAGTPLELPTNVLAHEGGWSPDGLTYWSSGLVAGSLTAIDVTEPAHPRILFTGFAGFPANHGFELSDDGNRMYLSTAFPAGVMILDVSDIQARKAAPSIRTLGRLSWNPVGVGQHAVPIRYRDKPYLVAVDEFGSEGARIIDIGDESAPQEVAHIQLEIQRPEHQALRNADTAGNGLFGYEAHYCSVDRRQDPTVLACGFFQSGIRVFDIRNPAAPREIAYFNPPAQTGAARLRLAGSEHAGGVGLTPTASDIPDTVATIGSYVLNLGQFSDANLSTDWCTSPPRFVGDQLWVACQDNGFLVLRFTNGVYPLQ
ncbi:hypothetical protein D0B54_17790 [Solimonas sp. K1W22B-7]|uniref:LVIVD repeat-containing protein n=1 Tax=Solimonas sp. K1W22B-7 TaxID=2303331 RepID=UPI000E3302BE|nr:hypothetical protein [Solimonas sp. K1W22B-7]AXQ30413.1 hypothetical protein D0B54_17790 [Solimonas sp. K1W22B-7]